MKRQPKTEEQKAKQRAEYRSEAKYIHAQPGRLVSRDDAAYDPKRDAPLHHADLTAVMMGDPPIGRRAIELRGQG